MNHRRKLAWGVLRRVMVPLGASILPAGFVSSSAYAQLSKPAPSAQDATAAEARARFDEGIKLGDAGDHDAARIKFHQAWALLKSPAILYNLARSEQVSGHPVEALEHYRVFAKLPADPKITDTQRHRAADAIADLVKKVGQIEVEAPPGARVSIDGHTVDTSSGDPFVVTPGKHVVEAIADGKAKSVIVDCPLGIVTTAKLTESVELPPPAPLSVAPTYTIVEPPKHLGPGFWTAGRLVGVTAAGVGLIGLGLGVVFQVGASSAKSDADDIRGNFPPETRRSACDPASGQAPPECPKLRELVDDQQSRETLRTAFFIVGGALLVGGAVFFFVSAPRSAPARGNLRFLPLATGREAGFALSGQF